MSESTYIGDAIAETEAHEGIDEPFAAPLNLAMKVKLETLKSVQSGEIITDEMRALAKMDEPLSLRRNPRHDDIPGYGELGKECDVCKGWMRTTNKTGAWAAHVDDCVWVRSRRICGDQT